MWQKLKWAWKISFLTALIWESRLPVCGQKKWDGGGTDSYWTNPLNWYPDGVPAANDTVIFDNQWVSSNYQVFFPEGMVASHAYAIHIQPASTLQISLILPNSNVASPAVTLSSMDTALKIANGGSFINISGAVAGNSIALSGKVKIENGGKYVHQTIRGNALLVSSLISNPETKLGIFEFKVPGNSAYIISSSGRTFGSLILSGTNDVKKTYTSSGSNPLTINSSLLITEQAIFNSSLTNNIIIKGDMLIKGRLDINPVSSDTIGRSIVTIGMNNTIEVTGAFNQGIHFRYWEITGSYRVLNSTITMAQPAGKIKIGADAILDLDVSRIKGAGSVITEPNVHISSSAPCIIGTDTACNIQIEQLDLSPMTNFMCYGNTGQVTGNRFPATISKLTINGSNTNLTLSRSLTINDSLILSNGKIIIPDSLTINIKKFISQGNDSSYVSGSILNTSENHTLFFPLGVDNVYAPIEIKRPQLFGHQYKVKSSRFTPLSPVSILYPLNRISNLVYWTILVNKSFNVNEQAKLVIKKNNIVDFNSIAYLDTIAQQWKPASSVLDNQDELTTDLDSFNTSIFTLGKINHQVLPLSNIFLQKKTTKEKILLLWKANDDHNAAFYLIEKSKDGIHFIPLDTIKSHQYHGEAMYSKEIKLIKHQKIYIRIKGTDIDGNHFNSNVVYLKNEDPRISVFPNPTNHLLYLANVNKANKIQIVDAQGKQYPVCYTMNGNMVEILTSNLTKGYYNLILHSADGVSNIQFLKQ